MNCWLSTASEVFLILTTQLYQYFSLFFIQFALFSDEPEVFLPKYSQTAILHAAHFQRVVNIQHKLEDRQISENTIDMLPKFGGGGDGMATREQHSQRLDCLEIIGK